MGSVTRGTVTELNYVSAVPEDERQRLLGKAQYPH